MYFNVNFNVFFKLIKMHLLLSELYIYQNARRKDIKKKNWTYSPINGRIKLNKDLNREHPRFSLVRSIYLRVA